MSRVTRAMLDNYVTRIARAAFTLGLLVEGDRLVLDIGSKTNGHAYRLWTVPAGHSGYSDRLGLGSDAYLGMTSAECHIGLRCICAALEAVVYRQEQAERD